MPPNAGDLSPLERQLSACLPSTTGLDADAMLFAAGQAASGRRARVVWPAVAGAFALISLGLGLALVGERSERLALVDRFSRQTPPIAETPTPPIAPLTVSPDSYLSIRQQVEHGGDNWLALAGNGTDAPLAPPPEPTILRASSPVGSALQY